MPPHFSTSTEGSCSDDLGCKNGDECSSIVGELDHAPILNRVRPGPKTGEARVLRGNEGSLEHFEEQSWNSSSYSYWGSDSNEKLGKDGPGVVCRWCGGTGKLDLLIVSGCDVSFPPLFLVPQRPHSRGLLMRDRKSVV